ncbi:MAG: SDR family oxidoreductase [Pseudomonadota bacterium]
MDVTGKTILITGAASGIGEALALECARRGASVALADIDLAGAEQTQAGCLAAGTADVSITAHQLDVANLAQWRSLKDLLLKHHGAIDGIINNAGVTFTGTVEHTPYEQLDRVMAINFMGMVYGTKEFLSHLKGRPEAVIANVSSVFGLYPMRNQSAYCASKFAIRGFTEVLAQELKGTSIAVSTIHPGHIGTDIVKNALHQTDTSKSPLSRAQQEAWADGFKALGMNPAQAAVDILAGLKKKKRKIVVGRDAKRGDRLSRLFPGWFIDSANRAAP